MNLSDLRDESVRRFGPEGLERVHECLDILLGRRRAPILHEDQEATRLCFPGLAAQPWHDPADWAWVPPLEAGWRAILDEYGAARAAQSFAPYEDRYTRDLGWPGWKTWHVYRDGAFTERARDLCPLTVEGVGASPHGVRECMFSVLVPGAHLKPHTGGVNLFLTVHLPLVVPPDCGLRVGEETRSWTPGKLLAFDDSFIHEAWNRSPHERVVLLWDIWHPDLSQKEVTVLRWLAPLLGDYLGGGH